MREAKAWTAEAKSDAVSEEHIPVRNHGNRLRDLVTTELRQVT